MLIAYNPAANSAKNIDNTFLFIVVPVALFVGGVIISQNSKNRKSFDIERDSNPRARERKLISSHRALIPFSASTCLFLPNFARFRPIFQDVLSKSPQN